MSTGRAQVAELLGLLVSENASGRKQAAETMSDWSDSYESFDPLAARVLVRVLALVASVEDSTSVRELELETLVDIFDSVRMTKDDVAPVLNIPIERLEPAALEHVDALRDLLADP